MIWPFHITNTPEAFQDQFFVYNWVATNMIDIDLEDTLKELRAVGVKLVFIDTQPTVTPVAVHNRTDFATSMINGRSVVELAPNSASAKEIKELWAYIEDRLQRLKPSYPMLVDTPDPVEEAKPEGSDEIEDFDLEDHFEDDLEDHTETSGPVYKAAESEVRDVMDLLGFDDKAITAEFEEFQEVILAQKEHTGFGRRASFGRRGNVRAIGV